MAIILSIETATSVCSVSIGKDGTCIAYKELIKENSHSSILTVMIDEILKEQNITAKDLSAISVSKGPGSYTGLRIGASVAKGMCYALDIPLIAVSTLKAMAWGMRNSDTFNSNVLFCPTIDARRMEVYATIVNSDLETIVEDSPVIIDEHSFSEHFKTNIVVFSGDGSKKIKQTIMNPNAQFIETEASARWMCELSEKSFINTIFEDTAYFTPFYLKEFQTTVPRKKT